jgi:hypothetical protein
VTIDGWKCEEDFPGQDWAMRTAVSGRVSITASADGLELCERCLDYQGGVGSYSLPANVLLWLTAVVR